jgi:putative FmdB family regulatory protein
VASDRTPPRWPAGPIGGAGGDPRRSTPPLDRRRFRGYNRGRSRFHEERVMPIYEYRCRDCGDRFEVLQRLGEGADRLTCGGCGAGSLEKQFSTFATASSPASAGAADGRDAMDCGAGACCGGGSCGFDPVN